jgi:hypothetical protein
MNTVYILGAGASAAAAKDTRRVLGTDFLRLAFDKYQSDSRLKEVRGFIQDVFHYDGDARFLPTVEEVLSAIDIAIDRGESLSEKYSFTRLQELRNHFVFLIYTVLAEAYRTLGNDVTEKFVKKLGEGPTVISLNYDIIIDNALKRKFGPELDYGFKYRAYNDFGGYVPPPNDPAYKFIKPNETKLYKIHGSLNWAMCPTCSVVYIADRKLGKVAGHTFNQSARCIEGGHAPLQPLIITPTNLKSYRQPQVSAIWQRAERALGDADKVVFIGYSIPDADFHIKYLLQKALYRSPGPQNNQRAQQTPAIVVVDFKPPSVGRPTPEEERFHRLFGRNVEYYPHGFEKYVSEKM